MDQPSKQCCTCLQSKSLGEFNRYSAAKDGLQPRCRQCQREKRVEWYAANRESEIAKADAWNRANPDRVRQSAAVRRAANPEKYRAKNSATYKRHGAAYQAHAKARRDSMLEAARESERLWRLKNKASIAERKRRYRVTNPNVRLSEKNSLHMRRQIVGQGSATVAQVAARIDYYGGLCWICGGEATSIDHVKPISKGGPHIPANLRPACVPCNSRKRSRWDGVEGIAVLAESILLNKF